MNCLRRRQIGSTSTTAEGHRLRPVKCLRYIGAAWNLTTELRHSVEAVHRLNDLGAVFTNAAT